MECVLGQCSVLAASDSVDVESRGGAGLLVWVWSHSFELAAQSTFDSHSGSECVSVTCASRVCGGAHHTETRVAAPRAGRRAGGAPRPCRGRDALLSGSGRTPATARHRSVHTVTSRGPQGVCSENHKSLLGTGTGYCALRSAPRALRSTFAVGRREAGSVVAHAACRTNTRNVVVRKQLHCGARLHPITRTAYCRPDVVLSSASN